MKTILHIAAISLLCITVRAEEAKDPALQRAEEIGKAIEGQIAELDAQIKILKEAQRVMKTMPMGEDRKAISDGLKIAIEYAREKSQAIGKRTKEIPVSPDNPVAVALSKETLEKLRDVLTQKAEMAPVAAAISDNPNAPLSPQHLATLVKFMDLHISLADQLVKEVLAATEKAKK